MGLLAFQSRNTEKGKKEPLISWALGHFWAKSLVRFVATIEGFQKRPALTLTEEKKNRENVQKRK
jgi:hypothetical protein